MRKESRRSFGWRQHVDHRDASTGVWKAALLLAVTLMTGSAAAQSSSLYHRTIPHSGDGPVRLEDTYGYIPAPPPRELRKHDIITVRVDEVQRVKSTGETSARRNALYDALLKDWPMLIGLKALKPSPQAQGDQRVNGQLNTIYRSEGELETNELVTFNISAEIVDIRPNGNIVIEAHKNVRVNNEVWSVSLTGECRPQDISPDNVVLSRHIANLQIQKFERGNVRESYRRGWFTKLFHLFQPF